MYLLFFGRIEICMITKIYDLEFSTSIVADFDLLLKGKAWRNLIEFIIHYQFYESPQTLFTTTEWFIHGETVQLQ